MWSFLLMQLARREVIDMSNVPGTRVTVCIPYKGLCTGVVQLGGHVLLD